jgi:hypothetical protein
MLDHIKIPSSSIPNPHSQTHRIELSLRRDNLSLPSINPFHCPKHRKGIIDIVVGDVLHVMIISNLIENAWPEIIFDQ